MKKQRFHILFTLRYLRYGLVLCLVPIVQALLAFDLDSLWIALKQDAAILAACGAAALGLWLATDFQLSRGAVTVSQGVLYRNMRVFSHASVAALEIVRPLYCRMLGASRLTLYFNADIAPRKYTVYLPKKRAVEAADALLPARTDRAVFEPTGFERLTFVMLTANVVTSSAFAVWGVRELDEVLGQDLQQVALDTLREALLLAARFLPTGLAFLVTIGFAAVGFTFLYALVHTAGFQVGRAGGVILSRGGFITHIERRVRVSCVSACKVCVTPAARLLRRYPVYVSAGSYHGGDLPVLVYKKGQEETVQRLLPNFCPPGTPLKDTANKSPVQFIWKPAMGLVLTLAVSGVALNAMPGILPVLAVPGVLSLGALIVSLEGFCREGVCKNKNRTLSVCYTRFFTRYETCVFTQDVAYTIAENPFSVSRGRCDLKVHLPGGLRCRARGVRQYLAKEIPFTL